MTVRYLLLLCASASLALTACSSGGAEQTYLDQVSDAGLADAFRDDEDALESGEAVCTLIGNGQPVDAIVAALAQRGLSESEAREIHDFATATLCP